MKVMHRRRVARATRKCRLVALNVIHGAAKSVVAIGSTDGVIGLRLVDS